MKTVIFVKVLKELEFVSRVDIDSEVGIIRVYDYNDKTIAEILIKQMQAYNTTFPAFLDLKPDQKSILMKYILNYSTTLLEKRVDQNRYVIPVIPRSMYLNAKYLYNGRVGLQLRDVSREQVRNKTFDDGFIFSEKKLKQLKEDRDIHINFDAAIKI